MSGLTTARILHGGNEVTVFEAEATVGGHAHTVEVPDGRGELVPIDAGVCMFYTSGYPNFFELLRRLNIPSEPSDMSTEIFSVPEGRRYRFDLNAPWKTIARSAFSHSQRWLIRDGARFYNHAMRAAASDVGAEDTLADHLEAESYSEEFRVFLSFLCGATWTLNQQAVCELPLGFVARTFHTLGFLPAWRHGIWHHVPGSVRRYLDALAAPFNDRIRLGCKVDKVERGTGKVTVYGDGFDEDFDQVVFALPAQKALACISEPTTEEAEVLSVFSSQNHEVLFTSDLALTNSWTPNRPTIFAASDVHEQRQESGREFLFRVGFTDLTQMCRLPLATPIYMWYQFPESPRPAAVHAGFRFTTPRFTTDILKAQARHARISGRDRIHFCGAGWTNGIHEGAVASALQVAQWFGRDLHDVQS